MGIVSYNPVEVVTEPNLPRVEPENYSSIVNDDKVNHIQNLLPYVEGAPWTVNYYSQILSKHNDIRELDTAQSNIYQQYQKINNLEIRVSSPLTDSYDSETTITSVVGNGFIYAGLIPNISDYFITDAGDHRTGIFKLTNVERKSFNRDSVYYIEYVLVNFIEVEPGTSIYNELNNKSIRTYYFSKDRLIENLQPLVREEEHNQILSLETYYSNIVNYYFNTFFNKRSNTLILPGQEKIIYDSYLVNYVLRIISTTDNPNILNIRELPTDKEFFMEQLQFWNIMFNRTYSDLTMCNDRMTLVNRLTLNSDVFLKGMYYTPVDYIIYPLNIDKTYSVGIVTEKASSSYELVETTNIKNILSSDIDPVYDEAGTTYKLIHPVLFNDYYVLSSNFYNDTNQQSLLEILVKDYLKGQSINLTKLLLLCTSYKSWARLEQFYYGPILLTLIKESSKNIYS